MPNHSSIRVEQSVLPPRRVRRARCFAIRLSYVALVTAGEDASGEGLEPLEAALHREGALVHITHWTDPWVQWGDFDAALLCFSWPHGFSPPAFRHWASRVASLTRLVEPPHDACRLAARATSANVVNGVPGILEHRFASARMVDLCVAALLGRCSIVPSDHPARLASPL